MRAPSEKWFTSIEKSRGRWRVVDIPPFKSSEFVDLNEETEESSIDFPIFPWITPVVHPAIMKLFVHLGVKVSFEANEQILFGKDNQVDHIAILTRGLTGRYFGSTSALPRRSMAISVPGRFACGNLNFFSHRPCIGRYYAIVPSELLVIKQSLLKGMCLRDPHLLNVISSQFELNNLSDRLGFGAQSMLSVKERALMFYLSWSAMFGKLVEADGTMWVDVPLPLRGEILADVVLCSPTALELALREIKQSRALVVQGDKARISLDALRPLYTWVCQSEEKGINGERASLEDILSIDF
mgnify:CR=1 FL=1